MGREDSAAQARAGVAGGRNVTLIRPGSKIGRERAASCTMRMQYKADTEHCKREQARDSRYAISLAEFKNNAWEILLVGGPGIMNNDFYGDGKTTCRLRWKKATQYAFAMKVCVCV